MCASHCDVGAEDGMATEDDEDDDDLLAPEMHAEPPSTAEAAQHAAQVAGQVRQAEIRERTRLEEDAIGTHPQHPSRLASCMHSNVCMQHAGHVL